MPGRRDHLFKGPESGKRSKHFSNTGRIVCLGHVGGGLAGAGVRLG